MSEIIFILYMRKLRSQVTISALTNLKKQWHIHNKSHLIMSTVCLDKDLGQGTAEKPCLFFTWSTASPGETHKGGEQDLGGTFIHCLGVDAGYQVGPELSCGLEHLYMSSLSMALGFHCTGTATGYWSSHTAAHRVKDPIEAVSPFMACSWKSHSIVPDIFYWL